MCHFCHRIVLAFAVLAIACGSGGSGSDGGPSDEAPAVRSVLLRWRATPDLAGYVIHWGTASGAYTDALDVGVPQPDDDGVTSFFLEEVGTSGTIYFAMTAYDEEGRTSTFSNEIAAIVP